MIWTLIITFFQIGLVGFGGGFAILSLIKNYCVDIHGWLTLEEFINLVTISQLTPGPILLNSAVFVGNKMAGFFGALATVVACVIPSIILIIILYGLYDRYHKLAIVDQLLQFLRPMIIALIASAAVTSSLLVLFHDGDKVLANLDVFAAVIGVVALLVLRKYKTNPLLTILLCGLTSLGSYWLLGIWS